MSDPSVTTSGTMAPGVGALLARAARGEARARVALQAAIDDVFLAPEDRLDDRTRAALVGLIEALVATIEGELREHAARLLVARGEAGIADALTPADVSTVERLAAAGAFRDPEFMAECLARVRVELIGAALPVEAPGKTDSASLLVELTASGDRVVAAAAAAVLTGESHRRTAAAGGRLAGTGLPMILHERLLWWVAAALRDRASARARDVAVLDRALTEAVLRNRAAHDDSDRLEAAAMRLAEAIAARPDELAMLLDEAMRDRRLIVFTALIATALGLNLVTARALVLDAGGDRLWLALRAVDLPRAAIARVGFRLSEADPRRDTEAFADALDAIAGVAPDVAAAALAPLSLPAGYRSALAAIEAAR